MKKIKWILLSFSVILILAACGQGEVDSEEPNNEETSGAELETNEENNEETVEENGTEEEEATEEENATEEKEEATLDSVTLFFSDDQLMEMYRVESDVSVTIDEDGAIKALELWINGPTHNELYSLLPESVSVQSVEFQDDVAYVSFSKEILDANLGSTGEAMLLDQIALMMQQFGFEQTQLLVDGETIVDFLGHIEVSEPITASNPEDYQIKE